jgi:hypothetical protein
MSDQPPEIRNIGAPWTKLRISARSSSCELYSGARDGGSRTAPPSARSSLQWTEPRVFGDH